MTRLWIKLPQIVDEVALQWPQTKSSIDIHGKQYRRCINCFNKWFYHFFFQYSGIAVYIFSTYRLKFKSNFYSNCFGTFAFFWQRLLQKFVTLDVNIGCCKKKNVRNSQLQNWCGQDCFFNSSFWWKFLLSLYFQSLFVSSRVSWLGLD